MHIKKLPLDWRNPISDLEFVLYKYNINLENEEEEYSDWQPFIRKAVSNLSKMQIQFRMDEWSVQYGQLFKKEQNNIRFPVLDSLNTWDWIFTLIYQIAEEQIINLGACWQERKKCRLGCDKWETAYHVISACPVQEYSVRHDSIVYLILK